MSYSLPRLNLLVNAAVTVPEKPQNYYKLYNVADRNVVQLNGYIGYWDDEALWLKNYLASRENEPIEVFITSTGGDVFTGQNMYNALKAHKGTITCYVQQAFSIASHIAMAADVVNIVKGSQMMIHAVSTSVYGTASDLESRIEMVKNAGSAIAQSYTDKSGQPLEVWLEVMKNDSGKFYTAQECLDLGLADSIIEPSEMTNYIPEDPPEPEEPETPVEPIINNVEEPIMPTPADRELARQTSVRNCFNSLSARLGLPLTLLNEAIDDKQTTVEIAMSNFAKYVEPDPKDTPPSTPLGFSANNAGGNGSDSKNMVTSILLNRAGYGEVAAEHKEYAGMDLLNAAKSLGVVGFGASLATNALAHQDFKDVIGEIAQEIVKQESTNNSTKVEKFCQTVKKNRTGTYGVTDYNQIDGFDIRKSNGEFNSLPFTGQPRRTGAIIERGSQVLLTREAILNDNFHVFAKMPKDHVEAAYRAADRLMYTRLVAYATANGLSSDKLAELVRKMATKLKEAVTSNGDDLYYAGGLIMSNPTNMDFIKPITQTKTLQVDVLNPAYGAFSEFDTAMRLGEWIVGTASGHKPLELAVLQGKERPELIENTAINPANGMGWTVVWDFDIQIANEKALVMGKVVAAAKAAAFKTEQDAAKEAEAAALAVVAAETEVMRK